MQIIVRRLERNDLRQDNSVLVGEREVFSKRALEAQQSDKAVQEIVAKHHLRLVQVSALKQ